MLDAVLLAEAKDHPNWSSLAGVVDDLPADNVRDAFQAAVDEVESQGNEHLRWTQDMRRRMVSLEPTSHHQRGGVSGCDPLLAAVVDQTRDASVSSSAHHPYQARNRPRPPARAGTASPAEVPHAAPGGRAV
jgi:hypothetical protein